MTRASRTALDAAAAWTEVAAQALYRASECMRAHRAEASARLADALAAEALRLGQERHMLRVEREVRARLRAKVRTL